MSGSVPELLNEMERDALTELINIGVSRAAANLRTMIGREVRLSVPCVAVAPRQDAVQAIGENSTTWLVAVQQTFEGDFEGRAMMIFPETSSLEVVRAVAADTLPVDDIVALEHEALTETGNIILNSCLATIANMLRRSLLMSLPEIVRGNGPELFEQSDGPGAGDLVLLIYINFSVDDRDIKGYIAMVMDLSGLHVLKELLDGLIERMTGVGPSKNAPR